MYTKALIFFLFPVLLLGKVQLGIDVLLEDVKFNRLKSKKIGLVTNHTGRTGQLQPTLNLLNRYPVKAIFCPEHGLDGVTHAGVHVAHSTYKGVPVYSLHGKTRRPTADMLKGLDTVIFDLQDVGVRVYTYTTTLFYMMEEAAKRNIEVIVLDRPNPIGGTIVDGSMMEERWRSFIGYINVPYCHGMTIGELARFFNGEYNTKCRLTVVPMKGWKRSMTFADTGLQWVPTSPHIPESDTPLYYAATGFLGELNVVNIGVGYTMPFKTVAAPWINADAFAEKLNAQNLPGIHFMPFHYKPFYGKFTGKVLHGVLLRVTNPRVYRPCSVQYALVGLLKSMYPKEFGQAVKTSNKAERDLFCKAVGTDRILKIIQHDQYIVWKLMGIHKEEREIFLQKRRKYLIPTYTFN